eukprot:evm.model.scf_1821.3 EVM.evm.TU.scf_1821.3   scf_1821:24281-24589(+)
MVLIGRRDLDTPTSLVRPSAPIFGQHRSASPSWRTQPVFVLEAWAVVYMECGAHRDEELHGIMHPMTGAFPSRGGGNQRKQEGTGVFMSTLWAVEAIAPSSR